jgi:hypothetical protein
MGYRYKERFEPDQGYHFHRDNLSVLVRAMSYGRRLTDDQTASYVKHTGRFMDALKSVDAPIPTLTKALVESDFVDHSDQPLYKYVSDSIWKYLSEGSFQFGTAKYYRETPNINVQDRHEGASTVHLTHDDIVGSQSQHCWRRVTNDNSIFDLRRCAISHCNRRFCRFGHGNIYWNGGGERHCGLFRQPRRVAK